MIPSIDRLLALMAALRDRETGCAWDRAQTFQSIAPYTIEEAYEVADAIARNDMTSLLDELGDLLFQVVFYAQMAKESGDFTFDDIVDAICDKMVRRHPHVFGEEKGQPTPARLRESWESAKAAERRARANAEGASDSVLDGVALALPALSRAVKLQKRAARAGFDWPDTAPVIAKIEEELGELRAEMSATPNPQRISEEFGDLLFSCVNLARHLGLDPEAALRAGNRKFERRFRAMEASLHARSHAFDDVSLAEMEVLWEAEKLKEQ